MRGGARRTAEEFFTSDQIVAQDRLDRQKRFALRLAKCRPLSQAEIHKLVSGRTRGNLSRNLRDKDVKDVVTNFIELAVSELKKNPDRSFNLAGYFSFKLIDVTPVQRRFSPFKAFTKGNRQPTTRKREFDMNINILLKLRRMLD